MRHQWLTVVLCCVGSAVTSADEVDLLVARLSKADAARAVPAFAHLDTSAPYVRESLQPLAEELPPGAAGSAELSRRVRAARAAIEARSQAQGAWKSTFDGDALDLPPPVPARNPNVRVTLDFTAARDVLALLEARVTDAAVVEARLRGSPAWPVFEALTRHRSQSFYATPLSVELLSLNLALASSDHPLPGLYAEANPHAFLDFADVRRHLTRYRELVVALEAGRDRIEGAVEARLLPYIPAGARLERRVSLLFCWGADGWASSGVAGIDLEYFKDDLPRLLDLLTHETYHVAQAALRPVEAGTRAVGPAQHRRRALDTLFREGTASHVAPPRRLPGEQTARLSAQGLQLLAALRKAVAAGNDAEARRVVDEGRSASGPFYWLGAMMAAAIERHRGPTGVADCLAEGTSAFLRAYQAAGHAGHAEPLPADWLE
jgi:hypothetical protein